MTTTQLIFGAKGFPRRIEDDPMFNGWSQALPRLWYLDQRQATRLDAESLFGASQYAVVYSRFNETFLSAVTETGVIASHGYDRNTITDLSLTGPFEISDRHANLTAPAAESLAAPSQSVAINKTVNPPTGVTATYQASGTQVTVAWTASVGSFTTGYSIKNPAGTVIGTVSAPTVSFVDPSPIEMSGGVYSVQATDGTSTSAYVNAPGLTINMQPATATATPAGENVTIAWTANGTQGAPDQWRVWNVTLSGWVSGLLTGATLSTTVAQVPGTSNTYAVYPYLSGVQGTGRNTGAVGILPRVTRPQFWGAVGMSNLQYQFYGPDAGVADNYDIDYYISSWVPWIYGTTSGGPHNLGTSSPAYVRSRTNSQGMSSPWTQSGPATPVTDVTGPPAVAVTIGSWDVAQAAYNLSWPSHYDSSGNGITRLQYSVSGGGWQEQSVAYPAGPGYSTLAGGFGRGVTVAFRLRMTDALGNETYGPASNTVWTRPLGGFIAYAANSYTWGSANGWGYLGNDRCYGGTANANENYGFWWYGTQIQDLCKTFTPDRMFFWSQKVSGISSAGIAYIAGHDSAAFNPGVVPTVSGIFHAPNLAVAADNTQFGAGWYPAFANGQIKGAVVVGNGQPFKALYGKNERSDSGAITIYFDA